MSDPTNILPLQLTENAKADSQHNLLHISVQVLLPSLGHEHRHGQGHGHGHGIPPPSILTLKFTGLYDVPELQDPKREAEGKIITPGARLAPPVNQACKFKVSKSNEKVTIIFTSLRLPHTELEVARFEGQGDLRVGTGIGRWGDAFLPLTDIHKPPLKGIIEEAKAVSEHGILRVTVKSPLFGKPPPPPPHRSLEFVGVYDGKEYQDPKREAQGKITFEFDHDFDLDRRCKFEVSKSGQNVTITVTPLQDDKERATFRGHGDLREGTGKGRWVDGLSADFGWNQDDLAQVINGLVTSGDDIYVYWQGTPEYRDAIVHRFPNGISEVTRCVLEPGNDGALRGLLENLATMRIPFGIKSGGHISVPKIYPPNQGILISMTRFNYIKYDEVKKTLDVGAGVIWKDVYDYLKSFDSDPAPGVVGGDPLVGVSGWLLGGGYSLLTNRFGLGIDNIIGFRAILPSKGICNVSHKENPEIFMALKGGGHNFGIITQFTLRVHDHAKRTAPILSQEFPESESSLVKEILVSFIEIQDVLPPAAVLLAAFRHDLKDGELKSIIPLYAWYTDSFLSRFPQVSKNREPGQSLAEAYEAFSLRHLPVSLETLKTDFQPVDLDSLPGLKGIVPEANKIHKNLLGPLQNETEIDRDSLTVFTVAGETVVMESPPDLRGRMAGIVVTTYTRTLIDEAENQAKVLSSFMKNNQGIRVSFEIWPFHKDAFKGVKREDSAWPHEEGKVFGPLVGWFEWSGRDNDKFWLDKIAKSLEKLRKVALDEKCTTEDLPLYLNITLEATSAKAIYRDHYEKLKRIRRECDPSDVMGLAAGFVIGTH